MTRAAILGGGVKREISEKMRLEKGPDQKGGNQLCACFVWGKKQQVQRSCDVLNV